MTFLMIKKWRERKVKSPLYLSIVFVLLTVALVALTIGLGEAVLTGFFKEIYRISLPLAYSTIIIADIFLFVFAEEITSKGKKAFAPLVLFGAVIIVILFLPWNWWGVPPVDYVGQLNIRLYSTLSVILYSYIVYIFISVFCLKARKQTQDIKTKTGLTLLFLSMISMIAFFLMFVFDTLLITLSDHPGYSEFVYIAWIFAILFFVFIYLSLVMPKWLVDRIEK
jgi:FtsH-binding integral membrane protein